MVNHALEAILLEKLPVRDVLQVPGFPFASYAEFQAAHRRGEAGLRTRFVGPQFEALSTSGERFLYFFSSWMPALIALGFFVAGLYSGHFLLLLGIPLALLGQFLSRPNRPLPRPLFLYPLVLWVSGSGVIATNPQPSPPPSPPLIFRFK